MRNLGGYVLLMLAGLGIAYWASLPEKNEDQGTVAIFSVEPKAVASLSYKIAADKEAGTSPKSVVATRKGEKFWIDVEETKTKKVKKKGDDGKDVESEEQETVNQTFLANNKLDELLKALSPLEAERIIGKVDAKDMEEFGLKDGTTTFTVKKQDGSTFELLLGKKSYGSKNRFAKESAEGRIVLIDGRNLENLERAEFRLYERNVVGFEPDEVASAEIKAGDKSKKMAHTQRNQKGELQWSDDKDGAPINASYKSWMDKIDRLRLMVFAKPEEAQAVEATPPVLAVTFFKGSQPLDTLVFAKTAEDGKDVYWVKSQHLTTWAKVSGNKAGAIIKDVPSILGE